MNSQKILFFDEVNFASLETKKFEIEKKLFLTFCRKKIIVEKFSCAKHRYEIFLSNPVIQRFFG